MARALIFFAILGGFAVTAAAQPAGGRLSVDEAVALALAHNRALANAELQAAKAEDEVATARSRRYPQFHVEAEVSQLLRPVEMRFAKGTFGSYPGIGPIPGEDTSLTTPSRPAILFSAQASQPLLGLRQINLNVRLSETSQALERELVRSNRVAIAYEVKRLYYEILQSESAIEASEHAITLYRELDRVVGDRVAQRVALKSDALDVETRLAEAEHARLRLRNGLSAQKEQLNQLLGRDVRTPVELAGMPPPSLTEVDLEAAQMRALELRPDIKQAQLKVQQAEIARRIARADSIPDLNFAVTYLSPLNIESAPKNIATAGLQLQWEPFDWGRRARTVAARTIDVKQAGNAARDAEDKALLEINARFRRLDEARSSLRVAAMAQATARETSRQRANQYLVRAALLSDVLQTTAAQADADNQHQQALLSLWLARADFERALGQDVTR